MKKKKILLVNGNPTYVNPFSEHGNITYALDEVEQSDVVVFVGGEDVTPSIYGEDLHPTTSFNIERDELEQSVYGKALQYGKPMVGICRGSQFLTVMNGGKLHQNVAHHAMCGNHKMYISETNREIMVTSTHHQMMIPEGRYDMLAWAFNRAFKEELEPEVVYYPDTRCLAVQYHPEYMPRNTAGWQYFQTLIKEYIL